MNDHSSEVSRSARFECLGSRSRLRHAWTIVGLAVLAALCLSPALKTGYISDDNIVTLKPGMIRVENKTLWTYTFDLVRTTMREGRFYPLVWLPSNGVICFIKNAYLYKLYIIVLV